MNDVESPLVAVWMITYNHEKFIGQAVESVVNQVTNFNYILYLSEDCSLDNTREICLGLKAKYPAKIELYTPEKNLGIGENGIGIQTYERCLNSGAKYMALLEGDDYWTDPYKLQKQVDHLEQESDCAGTFHTTQIINDRNEKIGDYQFKIGTKLHLKDVIAELLPFHPSSFLFRSKYLKLPEWFGRASSGDFVLYAMLASHGTLDFVNSIDPSIYRRHDGGVTAKDDHLNEGLHSNRIDLWNKVGTILPKKQLYLIRKVIYQHSFELLLISTKRKKIPSLRTVVTLVSSVRFWSLTKLKALLKAFLGNY